MAGVPTPPLQASVNVATTLVSAGSVASFEDIGDSGHDVIVFYLQHESKKVNSSTK